MKRLFLLCAVCIAAISCGEASDSLTNGHSGEHSGADNNALSVELEPRLQVIGLNDLLEVIDIHGLQFQARINLTPAGLGTGGDSVPIQFTLDESGARSETLERALQLSRSGRYNVYLEVAPLYENTASVRVESEISATVDQLERLKADFEPAPSPADEYEPAPSPADEYEPAPSPAEPAPSPADGSDNEPAPSPADEYEPAPSPADYRDEEPAPSPADGGDDEPAPSPAEPAPSPAEPAPSPAEPSREKPGDSPFILDPQGAVENGALLTHSYRTYYFHTGLVEITGDEHELVVTWDVRHWLSKLLADQLDLTVTNETDLRDALTDFRIEAR